MEWDIGLSLTSTVVHTAHTVTGLNSNVAFVLWFIRLWTQLGFYLSIIECCIAWYIIKVVFKRLILLNDELLACWIKITNVVVGLFLAIIQSKSTRFVQNVVYLSSNNSPSLMRDYIHGTNTR